MRFSLFLRNPGKATDEMNSRITVPPEAAGMRLDLFLLSHLEVDSRVAVQKQIQNGAVTCNGQIEKSAHKVRAGDIIEISFQGVKSEETRAAEPWDFPLEILFEDADMMAINKPPHVVTHPGAGNSSHTIANAVLKMRPEIGQVGHSSRPGIVHRLDKETSGVMLLAKTEAGYHRLTAMFKDRKMEKHYRALAFGLILENSGVIDAGLGRDPKDRKKISVRARKRRTALTQYRVLKQFDFAALLDVQIFTGRTHQIRVHLASIHHPIVGDSKYGGGNWNRIPNADLRERLKQTAFFGLHSFSLDFIHPISGQVLHIEAPPPEIWNLF